MIDTLPDRPRKGRGAVSNPTGRFEAHQRAAVDDGWAADLDDGDGALPPLATVLSVDSARTIITRNDSPDIPFDRSINPYRGCEHGCVYCFARPSHAYLGLSPGLDFETRLFYKPDAAKLLEAALRRPGYKPATLAIGTNTDPYQPVERKLGLTRSLLQVLSDFGHPVGLVTKSVLVARDLDILAPMGRRKLAHLCLSVTTLDPGLARQMEPRAASPRRRLETIRRATDAGVPVAVLASPMIPGLNDMELERILEAAAAAGAESAGYILIRLPLEIADLFEEWLRTHVPDRAEKVLNRIRRMRGGRIYQAAFGTRMRGTGTEADLLSDRFDKACRRLGLGPRSFALDTTRFAPPPAKGDQLSLL
ncbi:MAG: PA0069 family radical SAM protein [Rhodospirillaceae bacterium]|nr:PA0069 family radical SAM protein [Rhodospirillaceae bacterium]